MNFQIDVFAVEVALVRLVRGRKTAIAPVPCGPAFGAAGSSVAQVAIVLRAADDHAGSGIARAAIELGDAQVVVQFLPTAGQADVINVVGAVNSAVIAEVDGFNRRAIKGCALNDDMMICVRGVGSALPL